MLYFSTDPSYLILQIRPKELQSSAKKRNSTPTEMNCGPTSPDQLFPLGLSKLNWDASMHPLTSIVPTPIFGEMPSFKGSSPLSSMHVSRFIPFSADPGFAERAARNSCFSSGKHGPFSVNLDIPDTGKLSTVSSSLSVKAKESPAQSEMGDVEFGSGREDSSVTDQSSAPGEGSTKKRKAAPRRKVKMAEESDINTKKCRSTGFEKDGGMPKEEQNVDDKHTNGNGSKAPEPYKDYIHVRARRGQATDSHSLAERVRREKISQRMKLLQDLVPGCNKITGKALMLDEIINYVQSLQRQVEFLSMKLAAVNPRLDLNLETLITKESLLNQASACFPNSVYTLESFGHQSKETNLLPFSSPNCSIGPLDSALHQAAIMQSSLDLYEGSASEIGSLWDDELHSVLQASPWLNQEIGVTFQSFHGQLPTTQMKIER